MVYKFFFFCIAPNRTEFHILKIHHGGGLYEKDDILSYSSDKVTHVDWMNGEKISFADLAGIVYDLGYKERMELYDKYPGSQAFEEILSNQEMFEMFEVFSAIRIVNIYICDVNPIALKIVHPSEEEGSDINEDSQYDEFNEEE